MYQALYRKYRPRRFCDVSGQPHITETLRRQIQGGRLSHAYLFVGSRGTGKTSCAKILSRAVNCLSLDDGEPCNKCLSCIGIEDGSILDVLELDAASNNSVDNVRALRDEAVYSPATVKKRVYIIDEVHMLSISAFNALLKILEEPPEHILFILATTELHKVPATIQSRCQKFSFKRLSPTALAARLSLIAEGEKFTLTTEAADKLAVLADGSMRDGISLLDQCASDELIDLHRVLETLGLAGQQELIRLLGFVINRDVISALDILASLYEDGKDMASLLSELALLLRDLLIFKLSPNSGLLSATSNHSTLSELSDKTNPQWLFYSLDVLKTAIASLTRGGSSKLAVELCLIKICDERLSDSPDAMLSRLSKLEAGNLTLSAPVNIIENAKQNNNGAEKIEITDSVNAVESTAPSNDNISENELSDTVNAVEITPSNNEKITENELSAQVSDDDFWSGILAFIRSDPPVHALLSDNNKVQARHEGSTLTITVPDSFSANLIESEFSDLLREAAKKTLGRDVMIRVEIGTTTFRSEVILPVSKENNNMIVDDEDETNEDIKKRAKLDSLSALGIVKYEET